MLKIQLIDPAIGRTVAEMNYGERSRKQKQLGLIAAAQLHERHPSMTLRVESSKYGLLIYSEGFGLASFTLRKEAYVK